MFTEAGPGKKSRYRNGQMMLCLIGVSVLMYQCTTVRQAVQDRGCPGQGFSDLSAPDLGLSAPQAAVEETADVGDDSSTLCGTRGEVQRLGEWE